MANYCEASDVQAAMPDVDWTEKYTALLTLLCGRASRLIDRVTKRHDNAYLVSTATARLFDGSGCREQWVDEMAAAPTLVEVDEVGDFTYTTWSSTDYMVWPYNALAEGLPLLRLDIDQLNGDKSVWYRSPKSVRVTAKWGYSTTPPEDIKQATIIQAIRWFKRSQQAYQDVGAIVELGQLRYVNALDRDVVAIIDHYRKVVI